jgi:hypothetical protein
LLSGVRRVRAAALALTAACASCSTAGPPPDLYVPPPDTASTALIRGSRAAGQGALSPLTIVIDSIDGKPTGTPKSQRCNFDRPLRLTPGRHDFAVALIAGPPSSKNRVGGGRFSVMVKTGDDLVAHGSVESEAKGTAWIDYGLGGRAATPHVSFPLQPGPSTGARTLFGLLDDVCTDVQRP